ncbi:hypothetical protein Taro_019822 [Colocasia esculenta]|uniref:CCHC-type domain-containing protein n=1 Tax=Colocasia esculenta TaxID=4460 RepID=A0A843UXV8_COLES|nr:hypothetical protein [Colocasia esculenta]
MENNSEAHFWFDIWTGKTPLKVHIPEDAWHDMPNKGCTIQQVFSDPRSIHLQTALRYCPRHLLSQILITNDTKDTWIWCPTPNGTHNSFKGSVDTPHTGVDTMLQALSQKMKKWSSSVDTRSSQCVDTKPDGVDTRDLSQKACFAVLSSVSTQDEVVSTLETSPREVSLPVWDSVSTLDQVRSTHSRKCNKPGHMKGECPENKKEKYKKIHKFKKPKAMVATWSDEDSSENEEEEKSSSSKSEEIYFMVNSSDGKADPQEQEAVPLKYEAGPH